jgi:uncharacterized membrane protein YsdA (DUF1294 family)
MGWTSQHGYLIAYYVIVNTVTAAMYAHDKRAAIRSQRRVPELRLHILSLVGGWPAGFLSQRVLRHKTAKTGFACVFWLTAVMHTAVAWRVY